jgi:hypothetical protein
MGRVNDTISNVNSALRNLLLLVLIAGAGIAGYKGYDLYNAPRQQLADKQAELEKAAASLKQVTDDLAVKQKEVTELGSKLTETKEKLEKVELAKKLLLVQHRLARLKVLDQHEVASLNPVTPSDGTKTPPSKSNVLTKVEFTEVNEHGEAIGQSKQFEIDGDMVYVDYLNVTFDDKFVEQADLDRSTSLVLFQRVFGEHQQPVQGFQLDTVGTRPTAYGRGTETSDFEKKIWDDFWLIANDPKRAADLGIRAANGEAVSIRVRPGKTYEIDLKASGGMTIRPVEPPVPQANPPSGN